MSWSQFCSDIAQALMGLASAVIATLFTIYGPKIIGAFERKTNTEWTEQQRQVVLSAVRTAAGNVETALDQGRMSLADLHETHPVVAGQAAIATSRPRVASAMQAIDMTPGYLAHMIVGAVNTGSRTSVPITIEAGEVSVAPAPKPPPPIVPVRGV